jgi:N-acetylneuraminate lyase
MTQKYRGLWPAMLTPLDSAGRPALGETEKLVELFVQQNLDGIYLLGSTGQGPLLSVAERQAVAECVVRTAAGKIPVMVHVGAVSTDDSMALAQHASRIGADSISSVGPIYYRAGADAVFEHFRRIGAAGELPFFVYHLSVVNTLSLGGREYVDRLLGLPNIAGMKFTERDLYQLGLICAYAGDQLHVFSGADEVLCQAAMTGACGAIGTFYNIWGPACGKSLHDRLSTRDRRGPFVAVHLDISASGNADQVPHRHRPLPLAARSHRPPLERCGRGAIAGRGR